MLCLPLPKLWSEYRCPRTYAALSAWKILGFAKTSLTKLGAPYRATEVWGIFLRHR